MTKRAGDESSTLYYAGLLALTLHGVAILGLSFVLPPAEQPKPEQSLEITVVQPTPSETPEEAHFLAESSQQASGNIDEVAKPTVNPAMTAPVTVQTAVQNRTEPAPPPQPERPEPEQVDPRIQALEPEAKEQAPQRDPGENSRKPAFNPRELLANLDQEIRNLSAELDFRTEAYAQRPRRKAISAATKEHVYASYLEAWRRKVESVGNLNYPQEARRKSLFGSLVLHVAVRADGSVAKVQVVRSSGESVLDDAAVNIVRLAAPFAPFPPAIRDKVDILDITRTWQFLRGNRLSSK